MIGIDEIRTAAIELSPGSLKLYLYLVENVDGYDFWLSPSDVQKSYGISKSTYDRAKAQLIEKGYIVEDGNCIHFYANKEDRKAPINSLKENLNKVFKNVAINGDPEMIKMFKKKAGKIKELTSKEEQYKEMQRLLTEMKAYLEKEVIDYLF